MNVATKQCPLCAEDIPLGVTTCPFCNAKFTITSNGYCTTCHAVREAGETGLCKICGNPVADWRLESQLIEEPPPNSMQSAATPPVVASSLKPQPTIAKASSPARLYAVLGGILVVVVIAAGAWLGRSRIPAVAGLVVTPTSTFVPTSLPTRTRTPLPTDTPTVPSATPTIKPTATATPIPAWVAEFAEPLLADTANRPPNLDEDFSGKYGRYAWRKGPGVAISNGALDLSVTGSGPCTSTEQMNSNDFILQYDLTPKVIDPSGSAGIVFRHTSQNNQDIFCWLAVRDDWWDIACDNRSGDNSIASGSTQQRLGGRTTTVTLIINGDEMALYLDGEPAGYGQGGASMTGGGPNFCVHAPSSLNLYIYRQCEILGPEQPIRKAKLIQRDTLWATATFVETSLPGKKAPPTPPTSSALSSAWASNRPPPFICLARQQSRAGRPGW